MKEHRVGIRELKTNLSSVLRSVKAGNAVVITERGRPVGRILPGRGFFGGNADGGCSEETLVMERPQVAAFVPGNKASEVDFDFRSVARRP